MRSYLAVVCVVLALGACKKDKWEQAVTDLEGFRDKMCACKDKSGDRAIRQSCADDVEKSVKDWEKSMKDKFGKDDKPPDKLIERGDKAEKELRDCKKEIAKGADALKMQATMDQMVKFKDDMCKCADKACADKVMADMSKWGDEQAKNMGDFRPSDDDMKRMEELTKQLTDCSAKAQGVGGGSAAPATP